MKGPLTGGLGRVAVLEGFFGRRRKSGRLCWRLVSFVGDCGDRN